MGRVKPSPPLPPPPPGVYSHKKKGELLLIANIMNESYLKYGFILTGDCEPPCPLCLICNSKLSNEAMHPSKLLRHMKIKHPELEDKPLEFFERRKRDREGEKRLLRTALSTNSNALSIVFGVSPHR